MDEDYSLQVSHIGSNKKDILYKYDTPEANAGVLERELPENTQKIILDAIDGQGKDVKLSMACKTCHREINTPNNHDNADWEKSHGLYAVKELNECLNCHKDSLWIKQLEKQDIKTLLSETKPEELKSNNLSAAIDASRNNYFCTICHATPPKNHIDRDDWLFNSHRQESVTQEQRKNCYVCHDNEKPIGNKTTAPSDVYCDFCHKGLFSNEPKNL
ncbi:hypothetical protein [Bacillus sp. FJAT-18017]|uniref:hypothetical protein n=1 Tax=Bacillus sp. FJAT-18017 TaxID=1705566 RepID=UPI0006AFB311|nr:hypothetical protein [Bacillus sp. FJAT-18017]